MGLCIHLAQTRGGFYKHWFDRSRLKKKTKNPRLFLGETWSAFKREQVCFSVGVCNLSHDKLQLKSSPKAAVVVRLFQNCQSRTPHHCQYSFIPLWSKLAQFHNIICLGMNDIFKWKTGPIQPLIHLIGNEFFSGSFTHFAFCEYSVIATFSDVCVGNKSFQKRVSPDKSWPKACHFWVSGKSIWSSFDSCLWQCLKSLIGWAKNKFLYKSWWLSSSDLVLCLKRCQRHLFYAINLLWFKKNQKTKPTWRASGHFLSRELLSIFFHCLHLFVIYPNCA